MILVQNLIFIYRSNDGKDVIIFEADMSSSVQVELKNKDLFILGERPTQRVDGTTLRA